jgi:hypothetical protein
MRHLRDIRVLAEEAFEVTPCGGDGIGGAAGQKMKQRFLFNRVHMACNDLTIHKAEKRASPVFPNPTDAF